MSPNLKKILVAVVAVVFYIQNLHSISLHDSREYQREGQEYRFVPSIWINALRFSHGKQLSLDSVFRGQKPMLIWDPLGHMSYPVCNLSKVLGLILILDRAYSGTAVWLL